MGIKSNNQDQSYYNFFGATSEKAGNIDKTSGLVASGGTTQTYTSGSDNYKSHTFTSPGTFIISALGNIGSNEIDYLLVGGGGAGGADYYTNRAGGGGGAGAVVYKTSIPVSATGS